MLLTKYFTDSYELSSHSFHRVKIIDFEERPPNDIDTYIDTTEFCLGKFKKSRIICVFCHICMYISSDFLATKIMFSVLYPSPFHILFSTSSLIVVDLYNSNKNKTKILTQKVH